jgi:DtxR family Mn-dependent transcriptional regulator
MPYDLSASLEDYLEAIFHIVKEKGAARPKDIAMRLKVNNSSVTGALKSLAAKKLVHYAPYDIVTLTEEGDVLARDVVRRHEALKDFFVKVLSVEPDIAEVGACKMEHEVPRPILERFIQFAEYVELCPRGGTRFIEGFGYHCKSGCTLEECDHCLSESLDDVRARRVQQEGGDQPLRTLGSLQSGQRARIVGISGEEQDAKRLEEMGLSAGSIVEIERVAASGESFDCKVRGYHFSLTADDARRLQIEEL